LQHSEKDSTDQHEISIGLFPSCHSKENIKKESLIDIKKESKLNLKH